MESGNGMNFGSLKASNPHNSSFPRTLTQPVTAADVVVLFLVVAAKSAGCKNFGEHELGATQLKDVCSMCDITLDEATRTIHFSSAYNLLFFLLIIKK